MSIVSDSGQVRKEGQTSVFFLGGFLEDCVRPVEFTSPGTDRR